MKTLREIKFESVVNYIGARTGNDILVVQARASFDSGFDSGFKAAIELMRSEEGKAWSRQTFKEQMIYNLMDVSEWLESKLE